jgi:anthranilate phosphoribosyltransferase
MTTDALAPTWPDLYTSLLAGQELSRDRAVWAMEQVMRGEASPVQLAGFLMALRAKGESVEEMRALSDVMLEHANRIEVAGEAVDIVGTGGDRAHTVNISTMAAIVVSACGVPVVKHGNRAASSSSGSADVLEALGLSLSLAPDDVARVAAEAGMTFCFAQTFHPAMRHAAVARRDLGIGTAFNFLGPLTNPAQPRYAAIGVADARMAPIMAGVFANRGKDAAIFRGDDGLDELTTATTSTVWWVRSGEVTQVSLDPARLGLSYSPVDALRGGDAAHNAAVARRLLEGERSAVRDAVLLNSGIALAVVAGGREATGEHEPAGEHGSAGDSTVEGTERLYALVRRGMAEAERAIDSGQAADQLKRWISATRRFAPA